MQYIHITFFDGRNIMIDINISKVCKSFGFDLVLNNIDITVQKGEKVGLIGTNGSGKSTILKIIAGQESIDSGSLSIRNNISIGYLSQIPEEKDIIVKDYINSAFKEIIELKEKLERYEDKLLTEDYKVITKYMNLQEKFISLGGYEYETKIQKILPVFNITEEILNRNFNTLSGGEKTIISLIRLLLQEPDVLLLDEPTNHLDNEMIEYLEKYLIKFSPARSFCSPVFNTRAAFLSASGRERDAACIMEHCQLSGESTRPR